MLNFDPESVPAGERFDAWNEVIDRTFIPVRLEPVGQHPFQVEIGAQLIKNFSLVCVKGAGYNVHRGPAEIARSSDHFYLVSMHLSGDAKVITARGEKSLERGDIFVIDTMHNVTLSLERPYHHLLIKLPKDWIEARVSRPDLLCGAVIPHSNPLAQLYASYLIAGFQMGSQLSRSAAEMYSQHLLDLICEAFRADAGVSHCSSARHAAQFLHACRLIKVRLSDASLTPDSIARSMAISARTLHRIFAEHGESVMHYLLETRLDHATQLLRSNEAAKRSITEIAFACGFTDLTHFGRVFTEAHGSKPSVWRQRITYDARKEIEEKEHQNL